MSRHNKVNKGNYDQAGRLTPDEIARERMKQAEVTETKKEEDVTDSTGSSGGQAPSRPRNGRGGSE